MNHSILFITYEVDECSKQSRFEHNSSLLAYCRYYDEVKVISAIEMSNTAKLVLQARR